jgi:hypothetical protein
VICLSFRQSVTRMDLAKKKKGLERRRHRDVIPSTSPVRWQWVLQISQLGNVTRKLVITRSLWTFFFRSCVKGPRILPQIIQTVCICCNFVIAQHCPSCCLREGPSNSPPNYTDSLYMLQLCNCTTLSFLLLASRLHA